MGKRDVEDEVRIRVQTGDGEHSDRWWSIVQPPPSVAFSLRGRIGAALGTAADVAMRLMLRGIDEQAEADLEADGQTVGEAAAVRAFQRARSGRSIVDLGEDASAAAGRLMGVSSWAARVAGVSLDSALLLGEHERTGEALGFKWRKPSLLHRLLLDSRLKYGGDAPKARWVTGRTGEEHDGAPLWAAVNSGGVGEFVTALDRVVASPDELTMLAAWALLHLWRPF